MDNLLFCRFSEMTVVHVLNVALPIFVLFVRPYLSHYSDITLHFAFQLVFSSLSSICIARPHARLCLKLSSSL